MCISKQKEDRPCTLHGMQLMLPSNSCKITLLIQQNADQNVSKILPLFAATQAQQ